MVIGLLYYSPGKVAMRYVTKQTTHLFRMGLIAEMEFLATQRVLLR